MLFNIEDPQIKYNELRAIITERQKFENQNENKKLPYIKHPTDLNFFDIDGYTLLHYACLSGDEAAVSELVNDPNVNIEQIVLFSRKKITPLEMALAAGYPNIAEILFNKDATCTQVLVANVHPNCKVWFNEKVKQSLNESYPRLNEENLTEENFEKTQESRFFNNQYFDAPFIRLAELGDLEIIRKAESYWGLQSKLKNMFIQAASNGHKNLVEYLLSRGVELFPKNFSFKTTALHCAARYHQYEIVKYLLSLGIPINYQDELKKTPLMLAIESNDSEIVKLLLDNNADVTLKDVYGNCVLHYAVQQGNQGIINQLLHHQESELLFKIKNIYGFTAFDDKKNVKINHRHLLPKIHYFLALLYRDKDFLTIDGHCQGFSFLRNFYAAKGMKNYFYDTLKLISSWDGSFETLQQPFSKELPQSKYHDNLMSLLEQWTQDIIWFQAISTEELVGLKQKRINERYEFVKEANENDFIVPIWRLDYSSHVTFEQLNEYLSLIRKMPPGIQFDLGGGGHATSGDVTQNGIDFHDPNFEYRADPEQIDKSLAEIIVNVKYYAINHVNDDGTFDIRFYTFYFNHQFKDISLDKFELFSIDELPKNAEDAILFQKKSPCQFTHLHAAVFAGSVLTLKKLLQDGYCDVTAKNSFGHTIFDLILINKNIQMFHLILEYAADKFDLAKGLINCASSSGREYFFTALLKYAKPEDLVSLCIYSINSHQLNFVENFIKEHKNIVNQLSINNEGLLLSALKKDQFSIVNLLIENGADPFKKSDLKSDFGGEPKQVSAFQYVIENKLGDYFELFLGNDPKLLSLVEAYSSNYIKKEIQLLNEITFDSNNTMHEQLLSILISDAISTKEQSLLEVLIPKASKKLLDKLYDNKPLIVHAVLDKNYSLLNLLLNHGASVNNVTFPGKNTALHAALIKKLDLSFIELLIKHKAATNLKNKDNEDAILLASKASDDIKNLILPEFSDSKPRGPGFFK